MAFANTGLRAGQDLSPLFRGFLGMGALCLALAACVTPEPVRQPAPQASRAPQAPPRAVVERPPNSGPAQPHSAPRRVQPESPLQCVPYARARSGVAIYGDARTWYDQAEHKYQRSSAPSVGAVIVLGGTPGGHVAVVSAIVSAREILVDHANWANDGSVHLNAPVRDVSEAGDWSAVRVWHLASGQLGVRIYPVRGFVLPARELSAAEPPSPGAAGG